MKKVTKRNTSKTSDPIKLTPHQSKYVNKGTIRAVLEYTDIYSGDKKLLTNATIDQWKVELVNWAAKDEKALRMTQFPLAKGIHPEIWYRLLKEFPELQSAWEVARELISIRRETGSRHSTILPTILENSLPIYDEEKEAPRNWYQLIKWKAALRAQATGTSTSQPIIVQMEASPSSPLVPPKKKEEE